MNDSECVAFLQWALPRLRMHWPGFRKVRTQVRKRLQRRMAELGIGSVERYRSYLSAQPLEWKTLDSLCRITISRFYRDGAVFDAITQVLLPRLALSRQGAVACWSVGCGSGEEPYSLRIVWQLGPRSEAAGATFRVLGTDADERLLERARRGLYPASAARELPPEWRSRAFEELARGVRLRDSFREGVSFELRDIRDGMPPGPFDLVLCRNLVFTYFEHELRAELLVSLLDRLAAGGYLVIGTHETLPDGGPALSLEARGVYRKP